MSESQVKPTFLRHVPDIEQVLREKNSFILC